MGKAADEDARRWLEFKHSLAALVRQGGTIDERRKLLNSLLQNPDFALEMEVSDVAVACTASPFTLTNGKIIFSESEMNSFFDTLANQAKGNRFINTIHSLIVKACNDTVIGPILRGTTVSAEIQIDDVDPVDVEDDEDTAPEPGSLFDSLKEVG